MTDSDIRESYHRVDGTFMGGEFSRDTEKHVYSPRFWHTGLRVILAVAAAVARLRKPAWRRRL